MPASDDEPCGAVRKRNDKSTAMAQQQKNVFGEPIEVCSLNPTTGFYRTGCCHTGPEDVGVHTVCVEVTREFLAFSQSWRPLVSLRRTLAGGP
jgi:uncharacterized protein (DUF2237 family)